jgi:hypothetical protein
MGQAKIRNKNGTYPTREQIAQMEQERLRENTLWYPTADELPLLHIPEDIRQQLRKRLTPWLAHLTHTGGNTQRVGIKQGGCWRVAQALVMTAKDPNVKYVEGLWSHGAAHAWATVDGHRVDLINELFVRRDDSGERMYEPFQEFTYEELREAFVEENGYDEKTCAYYERRNDEPSFSIVHQRWLDDGNTVTTHRCHEMMTNCDCKDRSIRCQGWTSCDCEDEEVMETSFMRLSERLKSERLEDIAA